MYVYEDAYDVLFKEEFLPSAVNESENYAKRRAGSATDASCIYMYVMQEIPVCVYVNILPVSYWLWNTLKSVFFFKFVFSITVLKGMTASFNLYFWVHLLSLDFN